MGLKEYFHDKRVERDKTFQEEMELREKMARLEKFSGTLEAYEQLKKAKYEMIDVPGPIKHLQGGDAFLHEVWFEKDGKVHRTFFGNKDLGERYSEVTRRAVELGADAIVNYTTTARGYYSKYTETGIPVRKVTEPQNSQEE